MEVRGGAQPAGRAYTASEIGHWVDRAHGAGVILVPEVDLPAREDGTRSGERVGFDEEVLGDGVDVAKPLLQGA